MKSAPVSTKTKCTSLPDLLRTVWRRLLGFVRQPGRRMAHKLWRRWPNLGRRQLRWLLSRISWRKVQSHQALLVGLLKQRTSDQPVIIIAPSLDWNVQLFQRPQQLAMAFARQGALVFYMQPVPDFDQPAFQQLFANMYLCNTLTATFDVVSEPVVYLLTWNSDYRYQFCKPRLLYDYVDDIDVFYGDRQLIADGHKALLKDADLIVATAVRLHEGILSQRPDALLCPNGVEYERFSVARQQERPDAPADIKPILADGKPVIGYYGALARWFDYALMDQLVVLRTGYHFVLIGPDYDGTLRNEPLFQRANVHWLDVKPYFELPRYLAYFDVAIIPFVVSGITHATSPLKLFEYMAGGKPVVITPMEESLRYPGVLVGRGADEFALRLDEALTLRTDHNYLQTIDAVAFENTWDKRAQQILRRIKTHP